MAPELSENKSLKSWRQRRELELTDVVLVVELVRVEPELDELVLVEMAGALELSFRVEFLGKLGQRACEVVLRAVVRADQPDRAEMLDDVLRRDVERVHAQPRDRVEQNAEFRDRV